MSYFLQHSNTDSKLMTFNNKLLVTDVSAYYPSDGLVARWTLDSSLTDTESNHITLDYNDSIAYTNGKVNECFSWDGSARYLYKNDLNTIYNCFTARNAFSISLWFKTTDTNQMLYISAGGGTGVGKYVIALGLNTDGSLYSARLQIWYNHNAITTSEAYNDNNWHHVVTTYDGTYMRLYIDNKLYGSPLSSTYSINSTKLWLGLYDISGFSGNILNGLMDQIYLYNKALSELEISKLFFNGHGV